MFPSLPQIYEEKKEKKCNAYVRYQVIMRGREKGDLDPNYEKVKKE